MINYNQKKITFLTLEEMEFFIMDETMIVHLIVIELSKDVKGQYESLGKQYRKVHVFLLQIEKETKTYDKENREITDKKLTCKLNSLIVYIKFI